MNYLFRSTLTTIAAMMSAFALGGCQHINVQQLTYEMLRAEDCRLNNLDDFCSRTYASDYHNYIRLREDFLRSEEKHPQRYSTQDITNQLTLYMASEKY